MAVPPENSIRWRTGEQRNSAWGRGEGRLAAIVVASRARLDSADGRMQVKVSRGARDGEACQGSETCWIKGRSIALAAFYRGRAPSFKINMPEKWQLGATTCFAFGQMRI
jgi:hypothetical protein